MIKNLTFVFRKPDARDKKICFCDHSIIFPLNNYARFSLEKSGLIYSTLNDYFNTKEYPVFIDELTELIRECGDYPINSSDAATLKEFLTYEDVSLWELCRQHLADELSKDFFFYNIIRRIVDLEKPKTITILSSGKDCREDIIKSVAVKAGVELIIYCPGILSMIGYYYNQTFNYFLTRPHPFIDLFKNAPNSFVVIEKLQRLKERLIFFAQRDTHKVSLVDKSGGKKILAVSFANYHNFIKTMADIIKGFNKSDKALLIRVDVLSGDFKNFCRKQGVSFNSYYNYLSRDLDFKIKAALKVLLMKVKTIKFCNLSRYIENKMGFPIKNIFKRFLDNHFSYYGLLRLVRFRLITESVLEKEKAGLVIIQEDRTKFGQIVAIEARKKNVPSLVILQHVSSYDSFWNLFLHNHSFAKITAVTNNRAKNMLINYGLDKERIAVVGNPNYDAIIKNESNLESKENIYAKFNIDRNQEIFLFTSQPIPGSDVLHNALIKMMEDFPGKHLIIKLHPLESGLRSILKSRRSRFKNVTVVKDIDTRSLINCCRFLITISSITAFEAMIIKKPVIIFGLDFDAVTINLIENEAVYFVDRYKDLSLAAKRVLNDAVLRGKLIENADRYIEENLDLRDGSAQKRIVDLADELILK